MTVRQGAARSLARARAAGAARRGGAGGCRERCGTASASPAKADAALQKLSNLLPGSTANGEKDDGSAYPDLCACVRGRRVDAASVAELLPQRPYKWLQWLGGLGPLLNSPPQPSQLVLDTLVREIGKAV